MCSAGTGYSTQPVCSSAAVGREGGWHCLHFHEQHNSSGNVTAISISNSQILENE